MAFWGISSRDFTGRDGKINNQVKYDLSKNIRIRIRNSQFLLWLWINIYVIYISGKKNVVFVKVSEKIFNGCKLEIEYNLLTVWDMSENWI